MPKGISRSVGPNAARLAGMHLLSQADLAEALGLSRQAVNAIVTGRSRPSLETAVALAEFFGVPMVGGLMASPEDCVRAGAEAFERAPARTWKSSRVEVSREALEKVAEGLGDDAPHAVRAETAR